MLYMIIFGAIAIVLIMWFISTQHTLTMLDENINNAMSQIGVQLSSRWDALSSLLDLTRAYSEYEYHTLSQTIKARRPITADSPAQDAVEQENLLLSAMNRIAGIAEQYPSLKIDQYYIKTMESLNQYEGMVRQSRLVYNDSVTKLNRNVRIFPTSVVAGMMGFYKRNYLEASESNAYMPSIMTFP